MTADTNNNSSNRREDELVRQINQKMAELDHLRSQNKDLGDRVSKKGSPRNLYGLLIKFWRASVLGLLGF